MSSEELVLSELLEDTVRLAEEERKTDRLSEFTSFIQEMLPADILSALEETAGGASFIEDIWAERFEGRASEASATADVMGSVEGGEDGEILGEDCCLVCERVMRLTRHHLIPRQTHHSIQKKNKSKKEAAEIITKEQCNQTIAICRLCHSTIHRLFTNIELARTYNTLEALLSDERFFKYAQWASKLANGRQIRATA